MQFHRATQHRTGPARTPAGAEAETPFRPGVDGVS